MEVDRLLLDDLFQEIHRDYTRNGQHVTKPPRVCTHLRRDQFSKLDWGVGESVDASIA